MQYFQKFSEELSKISGISSTPISLFVYSIIGIVIIDLLARGLIFLNKAFNKNSKRLYGFNKQVKVMKIVLTFLVLFLIWEKQIQSILREMNIEELMAC